MSAAPARRTALEEALLLREGDLDINQFMKPLETKFLGVILSQLRQNQNSDG